jgi:hypothetical protein
MANNSLSKKDLASVKKLGIYVSEGTFEEFIMPDKFWETLYILQETLNMPAEKVLKLAIIEYFKKIKMEKEIAEKINTSKES